MKNKLAGNADCLLVERLISSERNKDLNDFEWDLVLRQARTAGVVERLSYFSREKKFFTIPSYVENHFDAANVFFTSQNRIVQWELSLLSKVFQQLQLPLVLLKGTAYVAAGLDVNFGRVFNDVDILVPENRLKEVKNALSWYGWFPEKMDKYDRRYYERWMHELPPMRHIERTTSLDIHHNILPKTCSCSPDSEKLYQDIVKVDTADFWVFKPEDMVLHSACHLFIGGEFENSLRDLSDLDLLLCQFSQEREGFFLSLIERSQEMGLQLPLFYTFRYTKTILKTPVPKDIEQMVCQMKGLKIKLMDFIFLRAFMPNHPSCNVRWTGLARWLLYIRSHYLRMPLYLLIPHLLRKNLMRFTKKARL